MSIRKRKSGHWQVRLTVDGKRIEQTLPTGATKADAQQVEAGLRRAVIDDAIGKPARHTIAAALDKWEASGARALRSWERDLQYRSRAVRQLAGDRTIDQLPALAAELTRNGLAAKSSPANINRHLAIVRRLANLCERWAWTDKPLGRRVQLLPGERARETYLTPAEVGRLLENMDPAVRDFATFLALTGLRRSEALRLTPADVQDGALRVDQRSKSGKSRLVPLNAHAARIARQRLPFSLTLPVIRKEWEAARVAAKLPDARLHDLRHAFASQLVGTGTDAATVRDLLGHSSLAVTSKYTQAVPEHARRAVNRLRIR